MITLLLVDVPSARIIAKSAGYIGAEPVGHKRSQSRLFSHSDWQLVRRAAPLVVASGLVVANPNILIYVIGWTSGARSEELVGVYGTLNYLPQIGTIVVTALGVATSTRLATYYLDGKFAEFYRVLWRLVGLCLLLGLLGQD